MMGWARIPSGVPPELLAKTFIISKEEGTVFDDRPSEAAAKLIQLEDRTFVYTFDRAKSIEVIVAKIVEYAPVKSIGARL